MPNRKKTFKRAKKEYVAAIKARSKALVNGLEDRDGLEKYHSLTAEEQSAEKAYCSAAEALLKSLHKKT